MHLHRNIYSNVLSIPIPPVLQFYVLFKIYNATCILIIYAVMGVGTVCSAETPLPIDEQTQ